MAVSLKEKYWRYDGFRISEDEDLVIFWSNAPKMPVASRW